MRCVIVRPDLADPVFINRWQTHAAVTGASAFLSWDWIGCLATERFDDPLLVETHAGEAMTGDAMAGDAMAGGTLTGLALFNRRRTPWSTSLHLHETGRPEQDAAFIEHNGPLADARHQAAVMAATLQAVRPLADRIVLSGIGDVALDVVRAQGGLIERLQTRMAPYATLSPGATFLNGLSRNTRAQLRRSDRDYARSGPIRVERAATAEQAAAYLAELLTLHTATWEARGVASGFASAPVQRFHRALIGPGVAAGTVDLLRITAGARVIGLLMNLRTAGVASAYQSGFDYTGAGAHEKPGLTCHHAAIGHAAATGAGLYDFLAGDSRYKRSLSQSSRPLHWLTWRPRPRLYRAVAWARDALGR